MKIPKYINKLLDRRVRLAEDLNSVDCKITKWITNNNIEVEEYEYNTGVEMYANPYASADRIRKAIENKENWLYIRNKL